jgi:adenylate cyclase
MSFFIGEHLRCALTYLPERTHPSLPPSYRWLAAAYGQLGCVEDAKEALRKGTAITPAPFVTPRGPWFRPEDHAHFLEGLRKAGMQEE